MLPEKKINVDFALLECIGIIAVVAGHTLNSGVELFTDWFPYGSYHMPLFVFISGYFFNESEEFIPFAKSKIKKLLLPTLLCNLFYGILVQILSYFNFISYASKLSLKTLLVEPFVSCHQFGLNVATWFAFSLVLTQIVYFGIRKLFAMLKIEKEEVKFLILLLFGVGLVYFSFANEIRTSQTAMPISHILFGLPFFQLGFWYRKKLEVKDLKRGNVVICLVIAYIVSYFRPDYQYGMVWGDFGGGGYKCS